MNRISVIKVLGRLFAIPIIIKEKPLNVSLLLTLQREINNVSDKLSVAIYWAEIKMGHVYRRDSRQRCNFSEKPPEKLKSLNNDDDNWKQFYAVVSV